MAKRKRSAADFFPKTISLTSLRQAAADCRGCDLYRQATQTVFGEGRARAPLMLVGEEPGDREDVEGHPFVGPAGALLRKALLQAGISLKDVYLTNAVKHFKYIWRGKRRIHQKPKRTEIVACRPWLQEEIELVRPDLVVALGATAAQVLLGASFRLTKHRGEVLQSDLAPRVMATVHPSSILRAPDAAARRQALADFVSDLKLVRRFMKA